jgi:hypothetical protein
MALESVGRARRGLQVIAFWSYAAKEQSPPILPPLQAIHPFGDGCEAQ